MKTLLRGILRGTLLGILALGASASAQNDATIQTIALGSCAKESRPQPIWESVLATDPDLFLFLGDNIYADTLDMQVMRDKYQKLANIDGFKKLKAAMPILATWDDHDYGLNDAGEEYEKREESQQIFLEFWGGADDPARTERKGIYHAEIYGEPGKRVQVIMLDTRYHRSPLKRVTANHPNGYNPYAPLEDPNATFLGEKQWEWLSEQLEKDAEVRIIGSSIQFIPEDHWFEKWANLPFERQRMFKLIARKKANGVIFVSGDRHLAEISMEWPEGYYPIYDLTSSGLNMGSKRWRAPEENQHRIGTMTWGNNFGLIEIDWERDDPQISLQIRDEESDVMIQRKFPLSLLQFRR
jgi:alkaline phosphatase D